MERNQNKSEGHWACTEGPYTLPQEAGHKLVSRPLVLQRWPVFTLLKITYRSTTQEEMDGWMDWPQAHMAPLTGRIH